MKKVLLLFISIFILSGKSFAYQTVVVEFPPKQGWHSAYYNSNDEEVILQYTPVGQNYENWTKSVIFHSYKNYDNTASAAKFMDMATSQMELKNSTQKYKYMKYTDADSIAIRCVEKNINTPKQCEIYRTSIGYEGLITMHYINKNTQDFYQTYDMWYQIIKDIKIYYSYYRTDRILDKAIQFEL